MKKKTPASSFDRLTPAQKEAVFQECERMGVDDGDPLTAADKRRHRNAGLRVGRPRVGQGVKRINISMEKDLLKTADTFARKHGITRARLIAQSVQTYLSGAA